MRKDKTKLNIAMLGQKHVPSREGGVEIVVEELSTRMVQRGHDVTCYNRKGHHISGKEFDSKKLREYKGVKLKSVFTINRKGLAAMTSSLFASIRVSLGRYDVVHYHKYHTVITKIHQNTISKQYPECLSDSSQQWSQLQ